MKNKQAVIREALRLVAKNNSSNGKFYHGILHTQMVMHWARLLAQAIWGAKFAWVDLIEIAAAWHDVIQNLGSGKNEMESARLAAQSMLRHGYSIEEAALVSEWILGTICTFKDGVMYQNAEQGDEPAKILADADLSSIGCPASDFVYMTKLLIAELAGKPYLELSEQEITAGWRTEVKFLSGRRFLTEMANDLLGSNLKNNLEIAKAMAGL